MRVFWVLSFACLTVSAVSVEGEDVKTNDTYIEKATTVIDDSMTTKSFQSVEVTENRINGENGWYIPQPDGTLQWMDMETVEILSNKKKLGILNLFKRVRFWLYTALSPDNGKEISTKLFDIENSGFSPEHPTIFIAHGFLQSKYSFSLNKLMREAYFEKGLYNIIYCAWSDALTPNYIRSSKQVPLVGKQISNLFEKMVKSYNMDCEKTHFIGHSLGAHVLGFAAKNIKICRVPKITALDPALPLFPFDKPDQRLNKTDAAYVESIQTDGGFYGHREPIGISSFYCNGGKDQPGCGLTPLFNVCCHERSVHYFREAVLRNSFPAKECDDYVSAINDRCSEEHSGVRMGDPNKNLVARGAYYVKTNDVPPYGV